jgi:hypothetical protein
MSIHFASSCLLSVALLSLGVLAGCNPSSPPPAAPAGGTPAAPTAAGEYDPHDKPLTEEQKTQLRQSTAQFARAVDVIQELRNTTETETKNGIPANPYEVHQALDKVDLVLQWLPEIARDSGVPKDRWEEVNTTASDLRTSFEKVHQNIDNKQDPNFASVANEIDQKIARLKEIAQAPASTKSETQP